MGEMNDISKAVSHAVDNATDSAHDAAHSLSLAANRASRMVSEKGEQLMHAQSRMTKSCQGFVQERPLTTVGIALAAGVVLGWLLQTKR
ncbi:DUF883 family protein [Candidatus Aalborgicola defluviihabitans]|uniref:DUF883 family protein n=1 Tax=Candidatus Aalborgicola defluviihabitans TaxID=3386187 RepID=UPI001EC361DC|nr:DUF883 family protein [Burkholderiales bacterium]